MKNWPFMLNSTSTDFFSFVFRTIIYKYIYILNRYYKQIVDLNGIRLSIFKQDFRFKPSKWKKNII